MAPDVSRPGHDGGVGLKLVDESTHADEEAYEALTDEAADGFEVTPDESRSSGRRGLPIWLFILVLIAFALVATWQARRAGELEAEVVRIEAELARSQGLLDAHRLHLSEIRGGFEDLSVRLQALRGLVDSDPAERAEEAAYDAVVEGEDLAIDRLEAGLLEDDASSAD